MDFGKSSCKYEKLTMKELFTVPALHTGFFQSLHLGFLTFGLLLLILDAVSGNQVRVDQKD